MNAPAELQFVLNSICPPMNPADKIAALEAECRRMAKLLERWNANFGDLLPLPFEIEIETPARVSGLPENCEPASSSYVEADDDLVRDAVRGLIERHMRELDADVTARQLARWRQP